jgi:hypothetical protein
MKYSKLQIAQILLIIVYWSWANAILLEIISLDGYKLIYLGILILSFLFFVSSEKHPIWMWILYLFMTILLVTFIMMGLALEGVRDLRF